MDIRTSQTSNTSKKQHDHLAKILVIGDGGVGKTSLITRFTDQRFNSSYTATIGVDFKSKVISYDHKTIKLQIWDTAGQERFRNITQAYYRGASGILLTFSLIDMRSFQNVQKWIMQMQQNAPKDCSKLLVATKNDLEGQRVVSRNQAQTLAMKMGVGYLETSSKTGEGVEHIFTKLGQLIYDTSLKKKIKVSQQNLKITCSRNDFQAKKKCSC